MRRTLVLAALVHAVVVVSGVDVCSLAADLSGCPYASLSSTKSTKIVVDDATGGCLYPGVDFAFQVWKGDPEKVAIVFRGSRTLTYDLSVFFALEGGFDVSPDIFADDPGAGIYSRSDTTNVLHDFTLISVPQCTADAHLGNASRTYLASPASPGVELRHFGSRNAEAVLSWAEANGLFTDVETLAVVGLSSGSIGAALYAKGIRERAAAPAAKTVLVLDANPSSFLSVEDDPCVGLLLNTQLLLQVDGCGLLPTADLDFKCRDNLGVDTVDIISEVMATLGDDVLVLEIFAKYDTFVVDSLANLGFAALEEKARIFPACAESSLAFPSVDAFYAATTNFARNISDAFPNYYSYVVDVDSHVSIDAATVLSTLGVLLPAPPNPFAAPLPAGSAPLSADIFFGTTTVTLPSPFSTITAQCDVGCASYPGPSLALWLSNAFDLDDDAEVCNECFGTLTTAFVGARTTCDATIASKPCIDELED